MTPINFEFHFDDLLTNLNSPSPTPKAKTLISLLHRILLELQVAVLVKTPSIESPMHATIKMKVFMFIFD